MEPGIDQRSFKANGMSPMFNKKRTEPNLSVGLRFGTDIIGWIF
jgi:hypothetical protein